MFQAELFFGLAGDAAAEEEEEEEEEGAAAGEFEADASESRPREKNDLKDRDELIYAARRRVAGGEFSTRRRRRRLCFDEMRALKKAEEAPPSVQFRTGNLVMLFVPLTPLCSSTALNTPLHLV